MADSDDGSRSRRDSHYNQQRSIRTPPRPQSGPNSRPLSRTPSSQLLHEVDDFTLFDASEVPPSPITAPEPPSPSPAAPWPLVPRIPQRKGSLEKGKREGSRNGTASRHGSRGSNTRTGSRGRNIDELLMPDAWAGLSEVEGPPPVQNPYERSRYQHHTLEEERTESRGSRWQRSTRSSHRHSTLGGRGTPGTDFDVTALPNIADNRYRREEPSFSPVATELYAISYLIIFSILGTLARLGLQWLTLYPGTPLAFSELWANVGGTFIMGFLSEDLRLFHMEWGNPHTVAPPRIPRRDGEKSDEEIQATKAHAKVKKTIPLYIGLATGFCGSFTSFSSVMRDIFLSFVNDLPSPVPGMATVPRNGGSSFMAGLAVVILTLAGCYAALKVGAHLAIFLDPITPTLPFRFTRRFFDPLIVFVAWGAWLGAVFMAIWPPDRPGGPSSRGAWDNETWRGQAIFACVFAPLGCLFRYYISLLLNPLIASFPLGTFTVNIFGTAVLAMAYDLQHVAVAGAGVGGGRVGCQILQGLMDGFCGHDILSDIFTTNMFGVKPPKIKTRTVSVPVKKMPGASAGVNNARKTSAASAPPTSRFNLTPSTKVRTSTDSAHAHAQSREPAHKSLSVSRIQQRKRKVTPSTPQWASSDESSEEDEDLLGVRKRQKTSSSIEPLGLNRCLEPDHKRRIRIELDAQKQENGSAESAESANGSQKPDKEGRLIHGLNMSRGEWVKDFKPAFLGRGDGNLVVELQYPSRAPPERFETVTPHDTTNFNPLDDIYFSIEEIIQHYIPPDLGAELSSEADGTVRLLKRAVTKNSPEGFKAALTSFNKIIKDNLENGAIAGVLDGMHAIPLSLVKRILAQVYQRTVSPHAHLLRRVKGKETTYGELLPTFVHSIFQQTGLNSQSVFIDLGSGVGNVVLQSALQTGAESWGIEIMDTPATFAEDQANELRARSRLWNISLGPITLIHGDFLESSTVDALLRRADVVLVNNKVFPQKLNGALLDKFLDLKEGCKVVSLESFGGGAGKQGVRNENSIATIFDEQRYDSGTNSVSWAGESVEYFIATKAR
ncbi:DOT1-domain-containing protein [Lentithecium fluviatile CBS 122367]|uniref:Histone-lysine N-methyltransferase, H3 lysine-79 specific n=1 Tax=Lentithecium fluviatile CBS 122367 TaxID=1168545 RepID=A0A6G1IL49_9PLEO|nr:DOT1-domain-containing protein [Lentithecium fluviatile CBS 122367]